MADADLANAGPRPPGPFVSGALGGLSLVVIAASAWLATQPGAQIAQTDLVLWFNDPPQPFAAVFAAVNPLLRPVPLLVVAMVLVGWVLLAASALAVSAGGCPRPGRRCHAR